MTAIDHLSSQFGVRHYEGSVHPGQVQPRQVGMIPDKVSRYADTMRAQGGYGDFPHVETISQHGVIGVTDGHHRRAAAAEAGLPTMPVYGTVMSGPMPDGVHEISSARYDELWNRQ